MDLSEKLDLCERIAQAADRFNMRVGQMIEHACATYFQHEPSPPGLFYLTDEQLRDAVNLYVKLSG